MRQRKPEPTQNKRNQDKHARLANLLEEADGINNIVASLVRTTAKLASTTNNQLYKTNQSSNDGKTQVLTTTYTKYNNLARVYYPIENGHTRK